ncbi:MAG: flagellar hook-basal body complex protein FliE, partial [Candidatus Eisenbacteria bacterium]|nr:flagellar hook-basal body complex protein FliE [Candidatus Eisenbacteria bacterium]
MNEIAPIRLQVPPAQLKGRPAAASGAFEDTLREFLQEVNGRQLRADAMTRGYARGDVQDLHKVVLAQQDAAVSLRLLVQ